MEVLGEESVGRTERLICIKNPQEKWVNSLNFVSERLIYATVNAGKDVNAVSGHQCSFLHCHAYLKDLCKRSQAQS